MLLLAVVLSLLVHAFGGGLLSWLSRLTHAAHPPEDELADATRITVQRRTPPPTPIPSPTPRPSSTPTPEPTPTPVPRLSAAPAIPRLATAPRRTPTPRRIALRPPAPHELARNRPHAPPQPPRIASAHGAYTTRQLASMEDQFRQTIASAQHAVAEGPPQTGSSSEGTAATTKHYTGTTIGTPADEVGGGGLCDNLAEETRGDRTYIYWRCRVHYSDGFTETVAFPWPFVYPRGHTPRPRESFPAQPPPDGFQLPQVFSLSRQVCYYFRDRCDAVLARERAAGMPDYGTPP
jgi:hypothetical protein